MICPKCKEYFVRMADAVSTKGEPMKPRQYKLCPDCRGKLKREEDTLPWTCWEYSRRNKDGNKMFTGLRMMRGGM